MKNFILTTEVLGNPVTDTSLISVSRGHGLLRALVVIAIMLCLLPLLKALCEEITNAGCLAVLLYYFDVLPRLKCVGFWIQAEIANRIGLTFPSPIVDVPTIFIFIAALKMFSTKVKTCAFTRHNFV